MSAALEVVGLHAGYGQAMVLNGITFNVDEGEVVAVVGANGAGKSTLLNTLAGVIRPNAGSIVFDGEDVTALAAHELPERGLVLVPEGGRLFPFMSVADNLELGGYALKDRKSIARRVDEVMELFPVLRERRDQLAGHLSGGERQMCAIARSVMSRPKLLMLDEPSVGLSPKMVAQVFALVQSLAASEGLTVVLVEQNVAEALEVSSRAYVLDHGRITRAGSSVDLRGDAAIQAAYMGL
ncbi:ABC transporter ATP-binding protein [Rhodoligotrophos defluvii]|uniref:ABC transporter ATP-binding protein n=1 Tax=Rhodoligotrophos defluvii TaxID=2561934 RepID=UPI0010C95984|nr:ABC transporter ATP-binding protein [Rhodoligotrophos defluvii]